MSETTKRTSHLTPFYLPSPDMADSAEMDLWERLHRDVPPRPPTFGAEGGAERETTNSPVEIGAVCTGRKMAIPFMVEWRILMMLSVFVPWLIVSAPMWLLGIAPAHSRWWFVLYAGIIGISAAIFLHVQRVLLSKRRASGGEGV